MSNPIRNIRARAFPVEFAHGFRNANASLSTIDHVWVDVSVAGMVGRGEATVFPAYSGETTESVLAAVEKHLKPVVLGVDLFAVDDLVDRMAAALPHNSFARSAVELALVDLRARVLGRPAVDLLGGARRDQVEYLASVSIDEPLAMASAALDCVSKGARSLQVKVIGSAQVTYERVRAIRDAIGGEVRIAIDGNGSFSRYEALRALDLLAPLDISLWEQPLVPHDLEGARMLNAENGIPIFADEALVTSADALRLVLEGAAGGFTVKFGKSGLHEAAGIVAIARAANLPCIAGGMIETNWGTFAGVHFAATLPTDYFPSGLTGPHLLRDQLTGCAPPAGKEPFSWQLPKGAGWGNEIVDIHTVCQ